MATPCIDTLLRCRFMHKRQLGLLAMRVDDTRPLEANRDGVTANDAQWSLVA